MEQSTRVLYSTSDNDFRFRNYNSKEFVTDDNGQIVGEYYPLQRNRNGGFRDLHVMQELYYTTRGGDRFSLAAWYLDSHRRTGDAHVRPQQKQTEEEYAGRTHAAGRGRLGAAAPRTETRAHARVTPTPICATCSSRIPKAKGGSSSIPTPGAASTRSSPRPKPNMRSARSGSSRPTPPSTSTGCAAATSR